MTRTRRTKRNGMELARRTTRGLAALAITLGGLVGATGGARAEVMTADQAVHRALEHNTQVINARADVLGARGELYGAYSGVLPRVSADLTRSGSRSDKRSGTQLFGTFVTQ